ncbi:MAG: hypothetical protein GY850_32260 [bacterium]|nr:hypothetical protein [bacterium]
MKIPWLTKKSIAAAAAGVLADYEDKIKRRVQPPIPVENIIERGLGLRLGFTDLRKKLKLSDVLGATYVKEKIICVDRSLAQDCRCGQRIRRLFQCVQTGADNQAAGSGVSEE